MQLYLPAIEGYVPSEIVCTFCSFLEFCYLVCQHVITEQTLKDIEDALACFHHYWEIFKSSKITVVETFSLPQQHTAKHYPELIHLFGAPNGLCSSITECKHIKAVKEPYWWSNRYNVIGQMLLTNQCLDKLASCHADFANCGMLEGTCLSAMLQSLQCLGKQNFIGEILRCWLCHSSLCLQHAKQRQSITMCQWGPTPYSFQHQPQPTNGKHTQQQWCCTGWPTNEPVLACRTCTDTM